MRSKLTGAAAAALLAAAMAVPAHAQQKNFGFGFHGAYTHAGPLAKSSTGTTLELNNKSAFGGNLEWWLPGGRFGLRADASHTNSPWLLEAGDAVDPTSVAGAQATLSSYRKVDFWAADADLMVRLLTPTIDRRFAPFVSVGGGFMRWDSHGVDRNDTTTLDLRVPEADAQIYGNAQSEPAVTGSVGSDFFVTRHVALRLEAKDYWNPSSPYIRLSELTNTDGSARHHNGGHNMMYMAGLTFLFGGGHQETPGFIAEAPAPEPAPVVVETPAPPAPTTEPVSMCVADANGQLQMVNGWRNLSDSQVYVSQNGQDVLFSTAYPTSQPQYVKGAPWYVAARPLILNLDSHDMGGDVDDELDDAAEKLAKNRMEFVNFGATQPLPMGDVLYIGSIDGTPLYATRSDIGDLMPDLEAHLRTSRDLDKVLNDETFATRFATEIQTFYTVVEPGNPVVAAATQGGVAGCVFQPMSSTHVVRRTRG